MNKKTKHQLRLIRSLLLGITDAINDMLGEDDE